MSGGIQFAKGASWIKAGWVYRATIAGVCEVLEEDGAPHELLHQVSETIREGRLEWLDIEEWPAEKQAALCRAIPRACARLRARGAEGWSSPEFLPGFLECLDELEAIVVSFTDAKKG